MNTDCEDDHDILRYRLKHNNFLLAEELSRD